MAPLRSYTPTIRLPPTAQLLRDRPSPRCGGTSSLLHRGSLWQRTPTCEHRSPVQLLLKAPCGQAWAGAGIFHTSFSVPGLVLAPAPAAGTAPPASPIRLLCTFPSPHHRLLGTVTSPHPQSHSLSLALCLSPASQLTGPWLFQPLSFSPCSFSATESILNP